MQTRFSIVFSVSEHMSSVTLLEYNSCDVIVSIIVRFDYCVDHCEVDVGVFSEQFLQPALAFVIGLEVDIGPVTGMTNMRVSVNQNCPNVNRNKLYVILALTSMLIDALQ